ncbi:alpha-ketoglutarate-dependent dioxygenase AlkB family protein [Maribacter sp. IgM3_T14_3]|uniref:alpha-ketoglutarate-dependent dioxygenase AlkB family protein n=1 Tax=Maribacter sp. IgM3_T14_3 TaxID=3415140 RepID=UPI003C6FEB2A
MELFDRSFDPRSNLLPKDGTVNYYGKILNWGNADLYLKTLLHKIPWKSDEAVIYGKRIVTKRKVAWYGDMPYAYTYSNTTKYALNWTNELLELKESIERTTGEKFNSCLLNLYHNGNEGMAWHSDAEKDLVKNGAIASLSLGAERRFLFRHKLTDEKRELLLEHGSLLVMKGATQSNWLHRLPPTKRITDPRINLTFRTIDKK